MTDIQRKGNEALAVADAIIRFPGSTINEIAYRSGVAAGRVRILMAASDIVRSLVEKGMVAITTKERGGVVMQRLVAGEQPIKVRGAATAGNYAPLDISKCPTEPLPVPASFLNNLTCQDERIRMIAEAAMEAMRVCVTTSKVKDRMLAFADMVKTIGEQSVEVSEERREMQDKCAKIEASISTTQAQLRAMMTMVVEGRIGELRNALALMQPISDQA